MKIGAFLVNAYNHLFTEKNKKLVEHYIITLAIVGYLAHLGIIFLNDIFEFDIPVLRENLLKDPISAIYTPFSFILVFEVYLLIYYLPRSLSTFIRKQYEIISLILIRRVFKDISNLKLKTDWFAYEYNIQFIFDLGGFVVLFFLIFLFYKIYKNTPKGPSNENMRKFINAKKVTSVLLLPVLVLMGVYSLVNWIIEVVQYNRGLLMGLSDVNDIFYNEFFTVLILVDVLILLISFRYTVQYNQLIRNSGFIISTILIRISFGTVGVLNVVLILTAVVFGVLILWIYNLFQRNT